MADMSPEAPLPNELAALKNYQLDHAFDEMCSAANKLPTSAF
jgi:hypothetical protein